MLKTLGYTGVKQIKEYFVHRYCVRARTLPVTVCVWQARSNGTQYEVEEIFQITDCKEYRIWNDVNTLLLAITLCEPPVRIRYNVATQYVVFQYGIC